MLPALRSPGRPGPHPAPPRPRPLPPPPPAPPARGRPPPRRGGAAPGAAAPPSPPPGPPAGPPPPAAPPPGPSIGILAVSPAVVTLHLNPAGLTYVGSFTLTAQGGPISS